MSEIKTELAALQVITKGSPSAIGELLKAEVETRTDSCDVHGEFESKHVFGKIWTRCNTCMANDAAERERVAQEKAANHKRAVWERKIQFSGIPERFRTRLLDSYDAKTDGQIQVLEFSKRYVEEFLDKKGRSVIFCGKPGTGKTHLAIGIGLELLKRDMLIAFCTVQKLIRRVKDSWRNDSIESETDVINLMVDPDLLILDEVGVQFGTEFEKNLMFEVLNTRYEQRKSTILLSNLTVPEVKVFLGERVYDRLREDGGVRVPFDWNSHRG